MCFELCKSWATWIKKKRCYAFLSQPLFVLVIDFIRFLFNDVFEIDIWVMIQFVRHFLLYFIAVTLFYFLISFDSLLDIEFYKDYFTSIKVVIIAALCLIDVLRRYKKCKSEQYQSAKDWLFFMSEANAYYFFTNVISGKE